MVLAVFYALLQLFLLAGLGVFLSRLRGWPRGLFHGFNRFVADVGLPVYFFTSISRTDVVSLRAAWIFPIVAVASVLVGLAFSVPLFGLTAFSRGDRRVGIGLSTLGNNGSLPLALMEILPLSLPALSERFGFSVVPLYLGTSLMVYSPVLWSLGNWLVAGTGSPGSESSSPRRSSGSSPASSRSVSGCSGRCSIRPCRSTTCSGPSSAWEPRRCRS
jgi:malate permease and related proteins